ncbi:DUF3888 domain-containing protein [Sutcliffiella rhizosphaerae]|uniref:Uncharacterized protein n=1 Tax=Sutcliffiella rhizosphaerae TaxID=2880967 RepID=A0ABM8YLQ9_9BACI|nr:DUF3888 domain-containing protein [Sutcliffiella rhizosphaerae]CAG9620906.1 hypothetical protein BACCIP111883_01678 [Sutcliffiella rhizosphaerae]
MNKILLTFAFIILIGAFSTNFGKAMVHPSGKVKKEIYASSDELLVDVLNPYITKIVREECGENVRWTFERVQNLKLLVDHTGSKSKSWYEVSLMINTTNSENEGNVWGIDVVTFNIDPKSYLGITEVKRENLEDVFIELKEYVHIHDHKLEKNL